MAMLMKVVVDPQTGRVVGFDAIVVPDEVVALLGPEVLTEIMDAVSSSDSAGDDSQEQPSWEELLQRAPKQGGPQEA